MSTFKFLPVLWQLVYAVIWALIAAASAYQFIKRRQIAVLLQLIGAAVGMLCYISYAVLYAIMIWSSFSASSVYAWSIIPSIGGFIAMLTFTIGFIIEKIGKARATHRAFPVEQVTEPTLPQI